MLQAVAEHYGIDSPLIPKIATGFCSGLSRTKGMCGALSGSIMAIGIVYGREDADDVLDHAYSKVQAFLRIFKQQYGSVNCFELIGYDLSTPEGREQFKSSGTRSKCQGYTGSAVRMAAGLFEDEDYVK
ncbi:MAG TPA: C-GCAxxG-C-C family protein [Thermodesulfovibrionales bacterium]|nr:C-GCAxxG-C-C family protein [Thermodesulfovibrionales bacterium]